MSYHVEASAFLTARARAEDRAKRLGENAVVKEARAKAFEKLRQRKQTPQPQKLTAAE